MLAEEQGERMKLMQEQLNAQHLSHSLEVQRLESLHVLEMAQLRKSNHTEMDRFKLQHEQGASGHSPLNFAADAPVVTGVPGHQKAWDASQLPLEQYLRYLDKFSEDASVLSTLGRRQGLLEGRGGGEGKGGQ